MDKPDVDFIEGLSPAISIDQKSATRNPRSTVGTITEIYDYLRLLYARIGIPHCPNCGRVITRQTPQQIVDRVLELPEGTRFQVLAPVVRGRKGEYDGLLDELARAGLHPGPDRRRGRRARRPQVGAARPLREPHDRGRRRPARAPRRASSAGSPTRSRPRCGSPRVWPRSRSSPRERATTRRRAGRDDSTFSEHLACTHCGLSLRRARAAQLLVQLAVRRVRAVRRSRHPLRGRPRARHRRRRPLDRRRRDRAVDRVPRRVLRPGARRGRRRSTASRSTRRGRS